MKKLFTILFSAISILTHAQAPGSPIGGIVVKGGKNPGGNALFSIGGGLNNPIGDTKDMANLANGYSLNTNIYVPLFVQEDGVGRTEHFFTIGFNVGGEYFGGHKANGLNNFPVYNIIGQTGMPSIAADNASQKQTGFKAEGGVQANFSFGKVTFSPILNAGYLSLQQKAFSITQTGTINGNAYNIETYDQAKARTTGFSILPKLRLSYFPGKIGVYLEGNYTNGPTITNNVVMFKPQGTPNDQGLYTQDQMAMGTKQNLATSIKYNNLGINIGINIPLGKGRDEKGMKRTIPRTYSGGRKNETSNLATGSPIGGIVVKGGKNPGGNLIILVTNDQGEFGFTALEAGNYTFSVAHPHPQGKSINEKGIKRTEAESSEIQRTYTGGRKNENITTVAKQTPDTSFGQKVSTGEALDAGLIVKGGKSPDGSSITATTNKKGEFELKNLEAGNYKFTITKPEGGQGKSISSKGVSSTKDRKN